jgi:hypothetical protein
MADTALVSVVISGAVGVLGLGVAALGQRRMAQTEELKLRAATAEEQQKRREARRDDLRQVIDDAAKTAMSIRVAASAEELGDRQAAVQEIRDVVLGAHEHLARIGVRVGPDHELYTRYQDVAAALDGWRAARARLRASAPGQADGELARAEALAAAGCKQALERFLGAATTEIGGWERLPGSAAGA